MKREIAVIKGEIVAIAHVEVDKDKNVLKIEKVIDILNCSTKYYRKL